MIIINTIYLHYMLMVLKLNENWNKLTIIKAIIRFIDHFILLNDDRCWYIINQWSVSGHDVFYSSNFMITTMKVNPIELSGERKVLLIFLFLFSSCICGNWLINISVNFMFKLDKTINLINLHDDLWVDYQGKTSLWLLLLVEHECYYYYDYVDNCNYWKQSNQDRVDCNYLIVLLPELFHFYPESFPLCSIFHRK